MKKEYDFSRGERGKFFNENVELNLPVYLDAEVLEFVQKIAQKKHLDISTVANSLLRGDMKLAEIIE